MHGKTWTPDEEEYLQDKWGGITIPTIAEKLDRTVNAIKLKANRLGLPRHIHSGEYLTINQFMGEVRNNSSYSYTLNQWIEKGMPVKYKRSINMKYKVIYIEEFWRWAKNNRTLINFAEIEEGFIGPEPKWVKEQRKADKLKTELFITTPWTKAEDYKLKHMLSKFKYSYSEISIALRRTEGAIVRRMSDLNIKMRPVKANNHNPWNDEEITMLVDLYIKGYDSNVIAYLLKTRGAKAVQGKLERMIKEDDLKSIKHKKCV